MTAWAKSMIRGGTSRFSPTVWRLGEDDGVWNALSWTGRGG
jgi:hypothetical protein